MKLLHYLGQFNNMHRYLDMNTREIFENVSSPSDDELIELGPFFGVSDNYTAPWFPYRLEGVAPYWEAGPLGTNYQDVAGQTPAVDVTDPLALMLDSSQRGWLAEELLSNVGGPFVSISDWLANTATTLSIDGGRLRITRDASGSVASAALSFVTEIGKMYSVNATQFVPGGANHSTRFVLGTAAHGNQVHGFGGGVDIEDFVLVATSNPTWLSLRSLTDWEDLDYSEIGTASVKELRGYHAIQPVTAAQPMLDETDGYPHQTFDGVDDYMTVDLPDLGTDVTRWSVGVEGISFDENLTVGAGEADLLADKGAQGYVDSTLTISQKNQFLKWAQEHYTAAKYPNMKTRMDEICMNMVAGCVGKDSPGVIDWRENMGGLGPELFSGFSSINEWVDNGDGSWTIDGSQSGNTDLRLDSTYSTGGKYVTFFEIENSSGDVFVYYSAASPRALGDGAHELYSVGYSPYLIFRATAGVSVTIKAVSIKITEQAWYWERLNTATRGATRNEPLNPLVIAEANRVVIYDGDTPDLPMWMVFNVGGSGSTETVLRYGSPVQTVSFMNGELFVGLDALGLVKIDFLKDEAFLFHPSRTTLYDWPTRNGLIDRNAPVNGPSVGVIPGSIANSTVNDVAITVLDGAPIDETTGLPALTVAAGTDGGVSVINNDGVVFDSVAMGVGFVTFNQSGVLFFALNSASSNTNLLSATVAAYTGGDSFAHAVIGSTTGINGVEVLGVSAKAIETVGDNEVFYASVDGLSILNLSASGGDMVAHITSDYNTGWLVGDVKGVWLSSTDDTDLIEAEMVTNGDFSTDTDWIRGIGWTIAAGVAVKEAGTQSYLVNDTSVTPVIGRSYHYSITVSGYVAGGAYAFIGGRLGAQLVANGTYTGTIVAANSSGVSGVLSNASFDGSVDDFSLVLADPDRCINANSLTVTGSITKTEVAAGAELVGYGGFSANSYLERPHNSDLDFGTDDFCFGVWSYTLSTSSGAGNLFQRNSSYNASPSLSHDYFIITRHGTTYKLNQANGPLTGIELVDTGLLASVNAWDLVVFRCLNGVLSLTVNDQSFTFPTNRLILDGSASPSLFVGPTATKLALMSVSATAPTDEQIAQMYADELPMFQPKTAITLNGATSNIAAVANDDDLNLLHVGQVDGVSIFDGLIRVSENDTPVTTAMAVHSGMVVRR